MHAIQFAAFACWTSLALATVPIEMPRAGPSATIVQQLQGLCIDTGAVRAKALAVARTAGWSENGYAVGGHLGVVEVHRIAGDRFEQRLILSERVGWVGRQKVIWRVCKLHVNDAPDTVRNDLEHFIGFRPTLSFDAALEWVVAPSNGHFSNLNDLSSWAARHALKHGPIGTITTSEHDGEVIVTYAQASGQLDGPAEH